MTIRHGARVGAAAFALGLALAGPQAAGSALADGGASDGPAVSSDSGDARGGAAKAGRSAGQARPARVAQPEVTGSVREGAAPARASATDRTDGPAAGGSPVEVRDDSAAQALETRVLSRSQRPSAPGSASRAGTGRGSQGRAPAVPVTDAADAVVAGGAPTATQVPIIRPGIPPSGEATMTAPLDAVQDVQATFFNTLANFLIDLPANDVTRFLEGALLMVRQRFFNQAPRVTPSPQSTTADGTIHGRIGAFDLEGDTLSYTVTGASQYGTVEVDSTGYYRYTPGPIYQGSDSFTVRIAPASRSLNILDWASDGSRDVVISIGSPTVYDAPDVAVNLQGIAGHIAVTRGWFGQYTGIVTLTDVTDDTRGAWLSTAGGFGGITVKEVAENYRAFTDRAAANGATVNLHLAFADVDGATKALILNDVKASVDSDGRYVFAGLVAPSPEIDETGVDAWDVAGRDFKPRFDAFLTTYNLDGGQGRFTTVDVDFTGADLYLDTITPLRYEQLGLYAQDSEPGAQATPPSVPVAPAPPALTSAPDGLLTGKGLSGVSAALSVGQSVYIGRDNGTVEVWAAGSSQKQLLAGFTADGKPPWGENVKVTTLTELDRVLLDQTGQRVASTFTGYIRGDELTVTGLGGGSTVLVGSEITAPGVAKGTIITAFVPRIVSQADCDVNTNKCNAGAAAGGVDGLKGTYKVSIPQTVGDSVSQVGDDAAAAGIVFTQKTLSGDVIPAVAQAVLVGLSNGSIQMYSPSVSASGIGTGGWTELHGFESGWGGVKAIIPYLDGFVVGLDNGYVRRWTGPNAGNPSTWKNNWEILYKPGTTEAPKYDGTSMAFNPSAAVTALMPFRDRPDICPGDSGKGGCAGFLVGRDDGSVLKYNEGAGGVGKPGWETLYQNVRSPVVGFVEYKKLIAGNNYLPSFAFALRNTYVGEWKWEPKNDDGNVQYGKYGVEKIQEPGVWGPGNEITSMTQLERGFVIGLGTSSVQLRDAKDNAWMELHDNGWRGKSDSNPVETLIPFRTDRSGTTRQGVIVGLANGSVQAWRGVITGRTGQNDWDELHDSGWASPVRAAAPAVGSAINLNGNAVVRDGLIIGLGNGTVLQWSGTITGRTGQGDWTQLEGIPANAAQNALGSVPALSDFTCDATWRCTQSGKLQQAVDFGKQLADNDSQWSGNTAQFGQQAGVGSATDPIFGADASGAGFLYPNPAGGKTYTFAYHQDISPEKLNYSVGGEAKIDFKGSVSLSSNCGAGGTARCAILTVNSVETSNKTVADIKTGMTLEPGTFYKFAGLKSTEIGEQVPGSTNQFYIDGFVPDADLGANIDNRLSGMSAQKPPSFKLGIDVNPTAYGYVVVPNGSFFDYFRPSRYSLGVLIATEIGPSIRVQQKFELPEKDFQLASLYSPGPLGFDSFILGAGAKLGGDVSLNGLGDKTSAAAYAYAVPGMLVTYNTAGAQEKVQIAFNYYLDANASDFKAISGATVNAKLTPYVNLLYGILIPPKVPLVGGWSLFTVGGGFENPITASLCVDASSSCPTADKKTGATASLTLGSSGALTFHAGLLDGITSALSYDKEIPLYQIPDYTKVLV